MFAKFSKTLNEFFFTSPKQQERESYLGKSVDFVDLEHRMHALLRNEPSADQLVSGQRAA